MHLPSNPNNSFLLLAYVKTVFLGTPQFASVSLLSIPFSKSFKASYFKSRSFLLELCFIDAMILFSKCGFRKQTFELKSNQNIRCHVFGKSLEIIKRNHPGKRKVFSRYLNVQDIKFTNIITCIFVKIVLELDLPSVNKTLREDIHTYVIILSTNLRLIASIPTSPFTSIVAIKCI